MKKSNPDIDGLLVESGPFRDASTQVNRLEEATMGDYQIPQTWEDLLLRGLALGFQVTEGETHKNEKVARDWGFPHIFFSRNFYLSRSLTSEHWRNKGQYAKVVFTPWQKNDRPIVANLT